MPPYVLGSKRSLGEIRSALGEAFVLEWGEPESGRLVYLDSFDWRLHRAGYTLEAGRSGRMVDLRLRRAGGEEWTSRIPGPPTFAGDLPPSALRDLLRSLLGIRALLPRARVRWRAETGATLNEDRKTVVRVRTLRGEAAPPDSGEYSPLAETLQILPLKGYGEEAGALRRFLRKELGLHPGRKTLLELAVAAQGRKMGEDPSVLALTLDPGEEAGRAARAIHRALLAVMAVNEDGLIRDLDSEFLHDFRVAVRRARTALGQIKGVFDPTMATWAAEELKWLGGRTGPTRDMDVYLLKIPEYQAALPEGVRDRLEPLVRFLEKKKRVEHGRLVRTLGTRRYRGFMGDWSRFLEEEREPGEPGPMEVVAPNAQRPILQVASERIWKVYKKVLDGGMAAGADAPAEALHALRIQGKRLRYLISFFQTLFPRQELKPLLKALKDLQENLGNFNDLHVQQVALRGFAEEMLAAGVAPPETLMAMGRLMGQMETQQEAERMAFHHHFSEFSRSRNVKRFKRLFKGTPETS